MPSEPQDRREELHTFIRRNTSTVPWPQVQEVLLERGYSREEIAAAVDEIFPGHNRRKKKSPVWGGLVGAAIGVAIWVVLAIIYRMTR